MSPSCDQHHHDHEHGHDGFRTPLAPPAPASDPAAKSLADALHISFKLLAAIMIFVLVAFALTGVKSIQPQERGIVKVFGRQIYVAKPGLVYNWPFPIGEIEIMPVHEATIEVNDFWLSESPSERTLPLSERQLRGLQPGWDGMLITGDRSLLHVRLSCSFMINDPITVRRRVMNLQELVSTAVCNAAIRAAATRTADGIQREDQNEFLRDIQAGAQRQLQVLLEVSDETEQPITITKVLLAQANYKTASVPLQVVAAQDAEQLARAEMEKAINTARAEAATTLNEAAGPSYVQLVGNAYEQGGAASQPADAYDLMGQYNAARIRNDAAESQRLLERIDEVLLTNATSGDASRILAQARAEKTDKIELARSRYQRFAELLGEYKKSPEFLMQRHWAEVREAILNSPLVEKVYIPQGKQKTVFQINRDPEVAKEIEREMLKAQPQRQ